MGERGCTVEKPKRPGHCVNSDRGSATTYKEAGAMERKLTAAERLAEPTQADIAGRLQADSRQLAARLDNYAGPIDEEFERSLAVLRTSIDGLLDGR